MWRNAWARVSERAQGKGKVVRGCEVGWMDERGDERGKLDLKYVKEVKVVR